MTTIDLTKCDQYIDAVMSGDRKAGKLERAAVERHLQDLDRMGHLFDVHAADHACQFFSKFLVHSKGEWAGKNFELEGWEEFGIRSLFGWKREDGTRRFRTAYFQVAKKNGKSTLAAGVGLYLFIADGEPGAEVYSVATKADQAKIVWDEAKRMAINSPDIKKRIGIYSNSLFHDLSASSFKPLSSDYKTLDGPNIHGIIVDELHAHKTRDVIDVIESGGGSRRQPLQFEITTAGYNKNSVCYEHFEYSKKILENAIQDDSWFAFIATIDEDDDWTDPTVWEKANPNFGVSVKQPQLIELCRKAKEQPAAQNSFRRLRLNQWTEQRDRWLDIGLWNKNDQKVDLDFLKGRRCFGGLDLSTKWDITAFVLVFPPEEPEEPFYVLPFFWIPEENIEKRSRDDQVPYDQWVRDGLIIATPGPIVDYRSIQKTILEDLFYRFLIEEIGYDPWNATETALKLAEEIEMVEVRQGARSLSEPMKSIASLCRAKRLAHGGNPVLTWMASNLVVRTDPNENVAPDKKASTERIDGMVAMIIAFNRILNQKNDGESIYSQRGLIVI